MKKPQRVTITAKVRQEVTWSGPCAYCGDILPTTVDHVIPVSRGGTNDRSNLVPACTSCNMEKLTFTPEEWREWREAEGYGWPPKSRAERFMDVLRETAERYGIPEAEMRERVLRSLIGKGLPG